MKITIDTKEDSAEDIRKVMSLLSTLLEGRSSSGPSNIFNEDSPSVGNAFGSMFGDNSDPPAESEPEEKKAADRITEY